MSLRVRLIIGIVVLAAVLAGSTGFVVARQRAYMVRQVDEQMDAAEGFVEPLVVFVSDPEAFESLAGPSAIAGAQLTGVTMAVLPTVGARIVTAATGGAAPDFDRLSSKSAAELNGGRFIVPSLDGRSSFRVGTFLASNGSYALVAMRLDAVEDATRQLLIMSIAMALLALVVVLALGYWVVRLGLRPIQAITSTADAIAAGDRNARVPGEDSSTEAGRLSRAFNLMLDERDDAEHRLRQFVADASHELRTPLTSIRGYIDMALDGSVAEEHLDGVLRRVHRESRRMHDLVEDLLLLANLDGGRPLRTDCVDIARLLDDAASDARAAQPHRSIITRVDGPLELVGDELRLAQVIAALTHNALVHTPDTAAIRLTAERRADDVVLQVSDDGPGIAPDLVPHVFDRFVRGDASRSRHAAGAGLGLAIAKSLVEAHRGHLAVTSVPGAGCTFTITLPAHRQALVLDDSRTSGQPVDQPVELNG